MNKSSKNASPPQWAERLLEWLAADHLLEEVQGDLQELFEKRLQYHSLRKARLFYVLDLLKLIHPRLWRKKSSSHTPLNPFIMFRHNLVIAFRNLQRRKAYVLINVLGLTLGIACAIQIFTLVKYHLSFDAFHTKADRIYRITTEFHNDKISYNPGVPSPLADAFRNDYTLAEKVALVASFPDQLISIASSGEIKKFEESIAFAEPAYFDILDFPLLQGNRNTVLAEPNTAIITKRLAAKYFGERNPVGQMIRIDNRLDFIITGILQDLPITTDQRQEIYLSYHNLKDHSPGIVEKDWWWSVSKSLQCFILLKPGIAPAQVKGALVNLSKKYYDENAAKLFQFRAQPLSDIHFNADLDGHMDKNNLWALSLIGFFLIITTCVNFINLATAQALSRSKEIGVRKVLGGMRRQLYWQFMAETAFIVMLSMGMALSLAYISLPYINQLFDTQLSISLFSDVYLLAFLSALLLVVIFFSGSYPGLVLAGFQPVLALKGKLTQRHIGGFSLRKSLVITQFAISQLLIIGTIVIANQMRYAQQADMGFDKETIVMVPVPDNEKSKISTLRSMIAQMAGVEKMTFCNAAPASELLPSTGIQFDSRTESEKFSIYLKAGDDQYASTFGLQILAGRNLNPSDTIREYLLNETALQKLGIASIQDAVGKTATINGYKGTIVGVVKDFHNRSFHAAIDPIYITTLSNNYVSCAVKVNVANLKPTLRTIEKAWNKVYADHIYTYTFLDEKIARFYALDNMMLRLIQLFAGIAIIIGCLGLYGLVSFMAAQKTKEVGIRKVLGASVGSILWLFGKEFIRLLLISFVVAAPVAWWVMDNWLENFTYQVEIGWSVFVLAVFITMGVAILAVGYKSVRAALMNPTRSLRSE
jgi:putative ABC transport system permease protein